MLNNSIESRKDLKAWRYLPESLLDSKSNVDYRLVSCTLAGAAPPFLPLLPLCRELENEHKWRLAPNGPGVPSGFSLCLSLLCHLQLPQGTPNEGDDGGTSFPCRRFAMAPSATSTATHYRRVCFMKVVSNSSPHTLLRLLTLAAQKDSGHARTGKAPPSSIRRRSSGGGKTSSCQSPFACHHSHHFRQRQMRRLALLSEAAFLLPPFSILQLFMCPCFMTLLYVPLCPHTVPSPLSPATLPSQVARAISFQNQTFRLSGKPEICSCFTKC